MPSHAVVDVATAPPNVMSREHGPAGAGPTRNFSLLFDRRGPKSSAARPRFVVSGRDGIVGRPGALPRNLVE